MDLFFCLLSVGLAVAEEAQVFRPCQMPIPTSDSESVSVGARLDREHSNVLDHHLRPINIKVNSILTVAKGIGRVLMKLSRPYDGYQIHCVVTFRVSSAMTFPSPGRIPMTARQTCHHINNCAPRHCKGGRFVKVTKSGTPKEPHTQSIRS